MNRDHVFLSYAWEDSALLEWLALKLTAAGYRVWADRFELLGGEPYPRDIDRTIKERAFRSARMTQLCCEPHMLDARNIEFTCL